MTATVRYPEHLLTLRRELEAIPGVACSLRNAGGKLYVSVSMPLAAQDEVGTTIVVAYPKARPTSGSYGALDVDVTWRVNP